MKKILFSALLLLFVGTVSGYRFMNRSAVFSASRQNNKLIIHNSSAEHFPGVNVACFVNGIRYASPYRFLPGKGNIRFNLHDFTAPAGETLADVSKIDRVVIEGGDQLIDEQIYEELPLK